MILDINNSGGQLLSGVPYDHELVYRSVSADVNGCVAAAILELGFEPRGKGFIG